MKIVFLTSSYYPYFSAIGKCILNIVNELEKEHEVVVISNMDITGLKSDEIYKNHKVKRIRTKNMILRDNLQNSEQQNKISIIAKSIELNILRSFEYFRTIFQKETIDYRLVNKYLTGLSELDNVDLIVPTCYPFESIIAAENYKNANPNSKLIPFLFDKYSDSPTLHRNLINKIIKYKRHTMLENKMIQNSDKVLYVDSWINKMSKDFSRYSKKSVHVEHPLIVKDYSKYKKNEKKTDFIDITYTGVLDKKVRPPIKTLEIMGRMIEVNDRFRFHFYILGNSTSIVNAYQKKYPNNIFNHGYVESHVAHEKLQNSNLLLSIGNTDTSLIPSKIFEYMSLGKPIIHFFNSNNDRVNSILNEYGLSKIVNQSSLITSKEVESLNKYCESNKNKSISFNEVHEIFYKATPEYISTILINNLTDK